VTTGNLVATPANVKLNIQTATVGVNYHFWSDGAPPLGRLDQPVRRQL